MSKKYGRLWYYIENNEAIITGCDKTVTRVEIPKYIENKKVTKIGYSAFGGCSLTSIVIPNSVTSIDAGAFSGCRLLISIIIPDSVTSIGTWAFSNCTSLKNITLPDTIVNIDYDAFINTDYYHNEPNWENGVLYLSKYLIKAKNTIRGNYQVKPGTKIIAGNAFGKCKKLNNITIPESVIDIGSYAFDCCTALTNITIPNSVTNIGNNAFQYCELLKNITISESINNIDSYAFASCKSLKSITIPDSVISVGDFVFFSCDSLKKIEGKFNTFPPKVDFLDLLEKLNKRYCSKIDNV